MIQTPVRLDRLQQGLFDVLTASTGVLVQWGYGEPSFDDLPSEFLNLILTNGPSPGLRRNVHGFVVLPPDSVELRITGADPLVQSRIVINGYAYRVDPEALDTVTTVRDVFVSEIDAGEPNILVTPIGVDGIVLVPAALGDIYKLEIGGDVVPVNVNIPGDAVLVTESSRSAVVTITAYSKGREPRDGAWNLAAAALATFEAADYVGALAAQCLAVRDKGPLVDLSAVDAAHWETRVAFDVTFAIGSSFTRPVDLIECADLILAVLDNGTVVETVEFTVTQP